MPNKISLIIRNILCVLLSIYVALWPLSSFAQTATLLPNGEQTFLDQDGNPLTSGTVDFYIPNTSTRKNTWKDAAETILNTNPVVLDAAGRAVILGDGAYRQVVKDRLGNLIWDKPVVSFNSGGTIITTGDGDLVGTIKPWAGFLAPNQYAFAYGQEVSRTTFSALLTAITQTTTVICTSTSNTITGLADTTQIPIGAKVELTCVPSGTTVVSKTGSSVTLSNPANISINASAIFFPYGDGNGTTTFNLPDLRGYVVAGRDNMGGSAASRLPTTYDAIGASGGNQSATLSLINLPSFSLPFNFNDPGHTHTYGHATSGATYSTPGGGGAFDTNTVISTSSSTTGITASINHIGGGGPATSALKVAVGSGYTNGAQVLTVTGGTCSVQPTVNVTIAGNVVSTVNSIATAGNCSIPPVNPAATTGGGGTGATLDVSYTTQPVSTVQPTFTLNYIIKVTPDSSAQQASGVSSLGGQIGAIGCSTGILCTGNNILIDTSITLTNASNPTLTGNWIFNPTSGVAITAIGAANSLSRVLDTTQTIAGAAGSTQQFNQISITDVANLGAFTGNGINIALNYGGGASQGNRQAIQAGVTLISPTNASNPTHFYVGGQFNAQANSGDNGTNTGAGAKGSLIGINPACTLGAAATNIAECSGIEVTIQTSAGATASEISGLQISDISGAGGIQGATLHDGIVLGNVTGSPGWKIGLAFDCTNFGACPVSTTGTLIGTVGNQIATNGIDFSGATLTNFLKGPNNFIVDGSGDLQLNTGGQLFWLNRSLIASPSDGVVKFTNFAATAGATLVGGSGTTGTQFSLQTTTGNGTTDALTIKGGNNGATALALFRPAQIGLGTETNPQNRLTISGNVATGLLGVLGAANSSTVQITDVDNTSPSLALIGFGTPIAPTFQFANARGTAASFTATQSGDALGIFGALGAVAANTWAGSGSNVARIRFVAAENFTSTNLGTIVTFDTTPIGSNLRAEAGRFQDTGCLSVGYTTACSIGVIAANAGFKSGASVGLSITKTVRASGGASDCTLIYVGGILTGGSC